MFDKILLPIDGSESCKKSWEYAKDLVKKYNSKIEVFYVNKDMWNKTFNTKCEKGKGCKETNLSDNCDITSEEFLKSSEKLKRDMICNMKKEIDEYFKECNDKVDFKVVDGDPAYKIIQRAENKDFDLIVICTRGMTAVKRFSIGSVTNKVVQNVKIPVLVIR